VQPSAAERKAEAAAAATSAKEARSHEEQAKEDERQERDAAYEQHREAREHAEQERTEERETRARRRREAREAAERENAPDSHHYPAAVRAAFLHECEKTSGHEDAACGCAIKHIEAKVPLGRFRQNESEVREGKPISFVYSFEMGYCASYEATG
jgi:hypothetical protein